MHITHNYRNHKDKSTTNWRDSDLILRFYIVGHKKAGAKSIINGKYLGYQRC